VYGCAPRPIKSWSFFAALDGREKTVQMFARDLLVETRKSNSGFFVSNMVFRSAVPVSNMKIARLLGDLKLCEDAPRAGLHGDIRFVPYISILPEMRPSA
jgi:hypothetical protein